MMYTVAQFFGMDDLPSIYKQLQLTGLPEYECLELCYIILRHHLNVFDIVHLRIIRECIVIYNTCILKNRTCKKSEKQTKLLAIMEAPEA